MENKEMQTRREFFKEAAQKALPILGGLVLISCNGGSSSAIEDLMKNTGTSASKLKNESASENAAENVSENASENASENPSENDELSCYGCNNRCMNFCDTTCYKGCKAHCKNGSNR